MRLFFLVFMLTLMSACGNKNAAFQEEILPKNAITNELIVQLKKDVTTEFLEKEFSKQEFKLIKQISAPMRAYLFTFNADLIQPTKMLEMVKSLDEVSSVEFNKKLGVRD